MRFDINYSTQGLPDDSSTYKEDFSFNGKDLEYEANIIKVNEKPGEPGKLICQLSENEYVLLANFITVNGLNKDYSFAPQAANVQDKVFESISVKITLDSVTGNISYMGYRSWLKQDENYHKAILFLDLLRYITIKCREK